MRSPAFLFATLALASAAFAVGCATEPQSEPLQEVASDESELRLSGNTIELSEADNGKSFSAGAGREIVLSLPLNASTGSRWTLKSSGILGAPQSSVQPCATPMPGCTGAQLFRWTASPQHIGQSAKVALELRGPGARGSVWKTFKVSVKVTPAPRRMCGGIAGLRCPAEFECKMPASRPGAADMAGTCVPAAAEPPTSMCGGIAGLRCPGELVCLMMPVREGAADMAGTCVTRRYVSQAPICGGFGGLQCPEDLRCVADPTAPDNVADATGICVR